MKTCKQCSSPFEVSEADSAFYEKISPVYGGKKFPIPEPTLCPTCRMQRRLAYRNDRSLYRSTENLTGKPVITMYNPKWGHTVYSEKDWWGDKWNPLDYGREYDPSKGFFEQFVNLQKAVPRFNVFNKDTENCDYVNYAPHSKNCYLLFGSWFDEDCLFGQTLNECKNCVDNLFLDHSELCYENIDSENNFGSLYCQNCSESTDSYFCYDCKNVRNCIGCWNLRSKSYHVENKPVSKDEFERLKNELSSYRKCREYAEKMRGIFLTHAIHKFRTDNGNENASGDFIFHCRNAKHSFSAYRCEDIAFSCRVFDQKDTYDFEGGGKGELLYENMSNDFSYFSISCTTSEYLNHAHYSDLCFNSSHLFGCVGLRQKKYCVLNKEYAENEYEALVSRIIESMQERGEWGEFFPIEKSPFAYNETLAQDYFPLTKKEAEERGWKWVEEEKQEISGVTKKIPASKLPDTISEIPDDILNWAITCEESGKPFRIQKAELEFYRKMGIPIPHFHPNVRHMKRMEKRNPRRLWERKCDGCGAQVESSYSPERREKLFCEACYLARVY